MRCLDRSKRFSDIYFYGCVYSNSVCVYVYVYNEYVVFVEKNKGSFATKARCMPGSCLTRQLPGKLGPSRRVLDGFPTTFPFSRARLSFLLACPARGEGGFHECVGFLGSFFVPISFVYERELGARGKWGEGRSMMILRRSRRCSGERDRRS